MRFDLRRVEEIWQLSNQLISIHSICFFSHKVNRERGSKSPFYFSIHSLSMSINIFFLHPITNYIVSNRHNGPLDLCCDFSYFIAITTIVKSSFPLFFEKKRFSNYPERWTWIIAISARINCITFPHNERADKPKSIYCLPTFYLLLLNSHVCCFER